nr:hypothetical protein CFP56_20356 [Quercus suber]
MASFVLQQHQPRKMRTIFRWSLLLAVRWTCQAFCPYSTPLISSFTVPEAHRNDRSKFNKDSSCQEKTRKLISARLAKTALPGNLLGNLPNTSSHLSLLGFYTLDIFRGSGASNARLVSTNSVRYQTERVNSLKYMTGSHSASTISHVDNTHGRAATIHIFGNSACWLQTSLAMPGRNFRRRENECIRVEKVGSDYKAFAAAILFLII